MNILKKKKIALFFILSLAPIVVNAQWKVGIGGGPSICYDNYRFKEYIYLNYILGASAFVYGQYDLSEHFGIRGGVDWTQKNKEFVFANVDDAKYKVIDNYIQLPIMAIGTIQICKRWNIFGNMGVYGACWLSSSLESELNYCGYKGINKEYDNRFDFGFVGGCGIECRILKQVGLQLEGRFYYGIISAKKEINGISHPRYNSVLVIQPSINYYF